MPEPTSAPPPVSVDLPEHWTHRTDVAPFALVAWPTDDARPGRPNLTVVVTHRGDRDLRGWADEQLGELGTSFPDPVLVHLDLDHARSRLAFTLAHAAGGVDRTLHQQHVLLPDGWVLATAVTVTDVDWAVQARDLVEAVGSTRVAPS